MRPYENLISTNLVLFDLPSKTYDQKQDKYLEKIFRRLLVFDQQPDNDIDSVLRESNYALAMEDPAFEILFHNDFEQYVNRKRQTPRWSKVKKDYGYYIESEIKRRNKENPYHVNSPETIEAWETVPDFSKQKRNQAWQFDYLYRDSQILAGEVYELTKDYKTKADKDLARARINAILVPDKLIFALNSGENYFDFAETEITVISIKMSLDAYKLAYTFLNRTIESLHKMRWANDHKVLVIDGAISKADRISESLLLRIQELERRFILFLESLGSDNAE